MKERIKHFYNNVKRRPMFWTFVLILIFFMPPALTAPAENDMVAVCTGVGVDLTDEGEVELSLLTLLPQNQLQFSDSYRFVSAKHENLPLAYSSLVNLLGKRIDLSHAGYVVFGDQACRDGLKVYVEEFLKSNNIGSNAIALAVNTTAKELLQATQDFDTYSGEKVRDILYNNKKNIADISSNLNDFYKDYLGTSSCSIISQIKLVGEEEEGVSPSGSQSSSSGGSSSSSNSGGGNEQAGKKTKVANDGTSVVFKDAKAVLILDTEQTKALNIIRPLDKEGYFVVKNYVTEDNNLVDVSFEMFDKIVSTDVSLVNNRAKITYNIKLMVDSLSIETQSQDPVTRIPEKTFEDPQMQQKINQKFNNDFFAVYEILKKDDLDCLDIGFTLKRCGSKIYREFVKSLGENPRLLDNVEIILNVSAMMR